MTIFCWMTSCYGFKGISIPATANTFFVDDFTIKSNKSPSDLNQLFSEKLRNKIRNESRLLYDEENADIIFSGAVVTFIPKSVAPVEGNTTALTRLEIAINVKYQNLNDEEDLWSQTFSFFEDFDASQDLQTVQDDLIDNILNQLAEDVFNKAFTNW